MKEKEIFKRKCQSNFAILLYLKEEKSKTNYKQTKLQKEETRKRELKLSVM